MNEDRLPRICYALLLLAVIAAGVGFRTADMADVITRTPDEYVYSDYAAAIADQGLPGVREVFSDYLGDPSSWIYPGPTRLTHVLMFAGMMKLTGLRDSRAGAAVSWIASIGALLLAAWIGIRFFNRWVGLLGAAFMAACFGELGCARRAWGDSTAACLGLIVMLIALEIRRSPRRRLLYLFLFAFGAAALLNKETTIFAYGLCGLWLVGVAAVEKRSWAVFGRVAFAGVASIAAAIIVWAILAGDAANAWASLHHVFGSGLGSAEWGQMYASGPWTQFIYFLWLVGPVSLVMAFAGIATLAGSDSWFQRVLEIPDRAGVSLAFFLAVSFIGAAAFGPNLQYLRIMAPADGAYCLLAGLGVWAAIRAVQNWLPAGFRRLPPVVAAGVLCLTAYRDYTTFNRVVVQTDMEDMSVVDVRTVMNR